MPVWSSPVFELDEVTRWRRVSWCVVADRSSPFSQAPRGPSRPPLLDHRESTEIFGQMKESRLRYPYSIRLRLPYEFFTTCFRTALLEDCILGHPRYACVNSMLTDAFHLSINPELRNHRDAKNTEVAQRKAKLGHHRSSGLGITTS